ncbi:hypothetical protein [Staphylococcus epidermidis]|uniref:hypothetical protein n=1 Tax=Staphylococcus epidermidis TaxID=1282 RepID=UPI0011A9BD85|nr:hypothetical protein [Staphylococcus epidermidis]
MYLRNEKVRDYEEVEKCDGDGLGELFKLMLKEGINVGGCKFEGWLLSREDSEEDMDGRVEGGDYGFSKMK